MFCAQELFLEKNRAMRDDMGFEIQPRDVDASEVGGFKFRGVPEKDYHWSSFERKLFSFNSIYRYLYVLQRYNCRKKYSVFTRVVDSFYMVHLSKVVKKK